MTVDPSTATAFSPAGAPDGPGDRVDEHSPALAAGADGLLRLANEAGLIQAAEVHVARRLGHLAGESDDRVRLALALTVRAVARAGAVCLDLGTVSALLPGFPWPEPASWRAAVLASPLVGQQVLRHDKGLFYLDRYWQQEVRLAEDLRSRDRAIPVDEDRARAALDRLFPDPRHVEQRLAAAACAETLTTVITGGPGTGKTSTMARVLALLSDLAGDRRLRVALAAPTGKAAARLHEAIAASAPYLEADDRRRIEGLTASTVHRLLGTVPGDGTRFVHHRGNRLPHDVVVIDEASMVSLSLMARLVEALRDDARLVLVGDPDQLPPVEAGAVLADVVEGFARRKPSPVTRLVTTHRYGQQIGALAEAVRTGDAERALLELRAGHPEVRFVEDDTPERALRPQLTQRAVDVHRQALAGDTTGAFQTLARHRLLCAHREGPFGVRHWNELVEQWLSQHTGDPLWSAMYVGRPLLATRNDYALGLFNGDTGVVVAGLEGAVAVFDSDSGQAGDGLVRIAPTRLHDVETMHAMTIHKSQGSQADEVTVLLPPPSSPLLTRELLYTAITRARDRVCLVGEEASVRAALARPVQRATGLAARLAAT